MNEQDTPILKAAAALFPLTFALFLGLLLTGCEPPEGNRANVSSGSSWLRWEDPESPVVCYRKFSIEGVSCVLVPYELRPAKEQDQ